MSIKFNCEFSSKINLIQIRYKCVRISELQHFSSGLNKTIYCTVVLKKIG